MTRKALVSALRSAIAPTLRSVALCFITATGATNAQQLPYPEHPLFPAVHEPEIPCSLPFQEFDDRSLWAANLWPNGIVYYTVNSNVTAANADRLRIAMNELETVAKLSFVPRTSQTAYVAVQSSTGNNSFVGRTGGAQTLNLASWTSRYVICHELMHALGIYHEQQRSDRGTYVVIDPANIQSQYYSANFPINSGAPQGTYDFESIMHYDPCAFSVCCPTGSSCSCPTDCRSINVLPAYAAFANLMGNRSYMSQGDKDGLVSRYGAPVDDAFAPNATLAAAKQINLGTTYTMKLLAMNDFFKVVVPQSTTLVVRAEATNVWGASNARLRVHTAAGKQLSQAFFATSAGVTNATVSKPLNPGTYVIEVLRTQPWGGSYTLSATASCKPLDFTGDNLVTDADFVIFLNAYNLMLCSEPTMPAGCPADINKDGMVDDSDFLFFSVAYDTMTCP